MSTKKIDALYLQGKGREDSFAFYYANLRPLLLRYARTIGRQSLRQVEDHLLDEMVDDLLMELGKFKGDSKFSTWAYVRFRRRFIDEYRYQFKNLGSSLESLQDDWSAQHSLDEDATSPYDSSYDPSIETDLIMGEVRERLSERQNVVLQAYFDGYTSEEIGTKLDVTRQRVEQIWGQIVSIAKNYAGERACG